LHTLRPSNQDINTADGFNIEIDRLNGLAIDLQAGLAKIAEISKDIMSRSAVVDHCWL
jgi:hypothetical protein